MTDWVSFLEDFLVKDISEKKDTSISDNFQVGLTIPSNRVSETNDEMVVHWNIAITITLPSLF